MSNVSSGSFSPIEFASSEASAWMLPSSAEMAQCDAETISQGTPALELMERAGGVVADQIMTILKGAVQQYVLVLCGPGNNGGDGLVVARHLAQHGVPVTALVAGAERYSAECMEQLKSFPSVVTVQPVAPALLAACASAQAICEEELSALFSSATVVVDALLGTGQHAILGDRISDLVRRVVQGRSERGDLAVVAVDIPTGIDCNTGAVTTPHITADLTVCIELIKRGLLQFPARAACGRIVVAAIGITVQKNIEFSAVHDSTLPKLSPRKSEAHKGDFGRVLVLGGSVSMPGAPILAALGALRSGAGLVSLVTKGSWRGALAPLECINELLPGEGAFMCQDDVARTLELAASNDVVVLGPGLGMAQETGQFVAAVIAGLTTLGKPAVIDADALNHIAQQGIKLSDLRALITPHPAEAGRLLGQTTAEIQSDRFAAVRELSQHYGCAVLLKGAGTLLYAEGKGALVPRGTPYLAVAGSGDVLSGVIAACMARTTTLFGAAALGAYIHAAAGEAASQRSSGPILASEIALAVPSIIGALER